MPGGRKGYAPGNESELNVKKIKINRNKDGSIIIPDDLRQHLVPNSEEELLLYQTPRGVWLQKAEPPLTRVYVEPTNACNLNCRTCIRHSWDEPVGTMDMAIYKRLIADLQDIKTLRKVSFWGFGEPLLHPHIGDMIKQAKQLGVKTEIITNALLLDREKAETLVSAGLDSIVISVDGTTVRANADIRSGADLNTVKSNVNLLRDVRRHTTDHNPEIGLEFVLMKKNLEELKGLRQLAFSMGASFVVITNLLPYTEEMKDEILYANSTDKQSPFIRSKWSPEIMMPPIDYRPEVAKLLGDFTAYSGSMSLPPVNPSSGEGYCRFIAEGSAVVSWDGEISPCIPLMHTYSCFILGREKEFKRYSIGNIAHQSLPEIMADRDFAAFRDRVQRFDFSPCTCCGGCDMAESNEEDCFGNTFPACGDCLWAKGVIQCP